MQEVNRAITSKFMLVFADKIAQNIRRRRVVDIFEYFIVKAPVAEAGVVNGDSSCRVVQGEDDGEAGRGDRNVVMTISVTGDDMDDTGDAGDDMDDTGDDMDDTGDTGDDMDDTGDTGDDMDDTPDTDDVYDTGDTGNDMDSSDIDSGEIAGGDIDDADIGDTSGDLVAIAERKDAT